MRWCNDDRYQTHDDLCKHMKVVHIFWIVVMDRCYLDPVLIATNHSVFVFHALLGWLQEPVRRSIGWIPSSGLIFQRWKLTVWQLSDGGTSITLAPWHVSAGSVEARKRSKNAYHHARDVTEDGVPSPHCLSPLRTGRPELCMWRQGNRLALVWERNWQLVHRLSVTISRSRFDSPPPPCMHAYSALPVQAACSSQSAYP